VIPKNKTQMASYLADAMYSSYDRYRKIQEFEHDTGLLKSYFIESHVIPRQRDSFHDEIFNFLQKIGQALRIQVFESEDETLFNLMHGKDTYHLDVSDPRFWIMHTLALSTRADKMRRDLIVSSPILDSAWLPTQLLERAARFGHFRGFGVVHDETPFITSRSEEVEVETMHLRLWGGSAAAVLDALRQSGIFGHSLALSSVRLRYWLPGLDDEAIIDNLTFEGKVTALGKSFMSHTNLISKVHANYSETIRKIEDKLPIRFVSQDGIAALEGNPIIINLSREVEDVPDFVSSVFSSALPFRLWGLSEVYENNFARVYAVDLHIGHKLTFEISKDFIRIYLPPNTCGNTVSRFYTNLQQYYDSMASISGGEFEQIF